MLKMLLSVANSKKIMKIAYKYEIFSITLNAINKFIIDEKHHAILILIEI